MAKYYKGIHKNGSFGGGSNTDINFITCRHNIIILLILQSYALYWYHKYLLHPVIDGT